MTFKNILVAVDFSPHAEEAVRVAADLGRRFEAKLTLLHVLQPPSYALPDGYYLYNASQLRDIVATFGTHLEALKKRALAAGATDVEVKQLEGAPAAEIASCARSQHCDLIVIGTHGRTGLPHLVLGSVAERVLRHAPCAVLAVRSPSTPQAQP